MDNSKLLKLVIEQLNESVNDEDIVDAWNEICDEDEKIYPMSDFNEVCDVFNYDSPKEIIERVREDFDGFDIDAEWFYTDCGSWYSIDDPMDKVDDECLAQYIIDGEVECGGIDIEELKKECVGKLRAFKDAEEFKEVTCGYLGHIVTMRRKSNGEVREGLVTEFRTVDERVAVYIGSSFYNMDDLFENYEYEQDGEWKSFGIADETTDSANED